MYAHLSAADLRVVVDALTVGRVSAEVPDDGLGVSPQAVRPHLEPPERRATYRPQGDCREKSRIHRYISAVFYINLGKFFSLQIYVDARVHWENAGLYDTSFRA